MTGGMGGGWAKRGSGVPMAERVRTMLASPAGQIRGGDRLTADMRAKIDAATPRKALVAPKTKVIDLKGKMVMEVHELNAQKDVRWRCIEGPAEWIGTDITFQLAQQDNQTIVLFGHRNWREAVEFTAHCSMKWATFLLSLREYVETGTGKPSPHDLKIDNWN